MAILPDRPPVHILWNVTERWNLADLVEVLVDGKRRLRTGRLRHDPLILIPLSATLRCVFGREVSRALCCIATIMFRRCHSSGHVRNYIASGGIPPKNGLWTPRQPPYPVQNDPFLLPHPQILRTAAETMRTARFFLGSTRAE